MRQKSCTKWHEPLRPWWRVGPLKKKICDTVTPYGNHTIQRGIVNIWNRTSFKNHYCFLIKRKFKLLCLNYRILILLGETWSLDHRTSLLKLDGDIYVFFIRRGKLVCINRLMYTILYTYLWLLFVFRIIEMYK